MLLEPLVKRGSIYYPMPAPFLFVVVCGRPVCAFSDHTVAHALHACRCTWYALYVSHAYMAPKQRTSYSRSCVVDHSNRVAEHCVTYNNTPGDEWPKLFSRQTPRDASMSGFRRDLLSKITTVFVLCGSRSVVLSCALVYGMRAQQYANMITLRPCRTSALCIGLQAPRFLSPS